MSRSRNQGLVHDTLFLGLTRPPMLFGVPYAAMLVNVVLTMEVFVVTKNLLWLLAAGPIHLAFYALCLHEPRFFELARLWGTTRGAALLRGTVRAWRANAYAPHVIDLPDRQGRRQAEALVILDRRPDAHA